MSARVHTTSKEKATLAQGHYRPSWRHKTVKPQEVRMGMRVKVADHHRIEQRRGLVGKVVGCFGGKEYVVVDVRFSDGRQRLFQPEDLEEITSSRPWWRSLLGGESES